MPRRITVFLSAPPGDGSRVAREHFHEYIKPILVAGALDWDVIEGRREGEVRAGLADKIRKLRKRNGERSQLDSGAESNEEEDLLEQARRRTGIREWDGLQGDLVLGRHTWKEYIRGLHEGWLGPLDAPLHPDAGAPLSLSEQAPANQEPESAPQTSAVSLAQPRESLQQQDSTQSQEPALETPDTPPATPFKKPSLIPPYIPPSAYPTSPVPPSIPPTLPPCLPLPLPHLLGFFNIPTRVYRFLTKRKLAETTGASVAAIVLASHYRAYNSSTTTPPTLSTKNDGSNSFSSSPAAENEPAERTDKRIWWEQEQVLAEEETDWHKIVWKDDEKESEEWKSRERTWRDDVVVDDRIGARMRVFELLPAEAERAVREEAKRKSNDGWAPAWWKGASDWVMGGEDKKEKGWEMGFVGGEDD